MTDREEFEAWYASQDQSEPEPEKTYELSESGMEDLTKDCLFQGWRAARAQPAEQEPVANVTISHFRGNPAMENVDFQLQADLPVGTHMLYTHPQPKTVPLSVEAYTALAHRTASKYRHNGNPLHIEYTFLPHTLGDFVRAIEAAHGIEATKGGA